MLGIPLVLLLVAMVCALGVFSFELLIGVFFLSAIGYIIADELFDAATLIQNWLVEAGAPVPVAMVLDGPMATVFGIACALASVVALVALIGGIVFLLGRLNRKEERE